MCLFWELRAEGRGREKWRERRGRAGWRLYLLERTEAPTPTRPPTPSLSNIVPKLPSLCQRLHPQSPHLSRGRMLTAFWSSNCVRVTLLTSQLTCFCSAVGRSSGRMMRIRRRLLRTSPLTQWVKRGVWNGDEQTAAGSAQSWDHHLSVSWLLRMTSELHVVPTQNCASTQGAGEEKLGHHERVPPPLPRPSLLSLLLHLLLAPPPPLPQKQTNTHTLGTFFLHPWCSIFRWEAFFGHGRGSGIVWRINGKSTSRLVMFTVWSFRLRSSSVQCQTSWDYCHAKFENLFP